MLYAPSISDDDAPTSERYTRWDEFVPALLDELAAIGYLPHSGQAWSHHNYTDVERRQTATRSQAIRALLEGRWAGYTRAEAPTVFVTEGGARLSRMPALYPPRTRAQAQAKCLRDAWALHQRAAAPGPAWRCSRSTCSTPTPTSTAAARPVPEHGETPGLCGLEGVSRVLVRRLGGRAALAAFAPAPLPPPV